jgi:hypothetical protein
MMILVYIRSPKRYTVAARNGAVAKENGTKYRDRMYTAVNKISPVADRKLKNGSKFTSTLSDDSVALYSDEVFFCGCSCSATELPTPQITDLADSVSLSLEWFTDPVSNETACPNIVIIAKSAVAYKSGPAYNMDSDGSPRVSA